MQRGVISSQRVTAEIDTSRRQDTARNHTVTHLLHKALRSVLGEHVQQKGSLVHPDYMRFDFTHFQALSTSQWKVVESLVNKAIRANRKVSTTIQDIASAKADGAIALFGEKYSDSVRVVSVENYSKELCGGTHVSATGEIGLFKITSEGSIAAGIRRIEAVTGRAALDYVNELQSSLTRVSEALHCPVVMVQSRLEAMKDRVKELETELKTLRSTNSLAAMDSVLAQAVDFDGQRLAIASLPPDTDLKGISEHMKGKLKDQILILLSEKAAKLSLMVMVGDNLTGKYNAGKIVSAMAMHIGGKGGGRPESAMAGAPMPENLNAYIDHIPELIRSTQ
jgi:alanyl-tRNA synthetase